MAKETLTLATSELATCICGSEASVYWPEKQRKVLVIPFLLFEAKVMCSSQGLPYQYQELIQYSEESVNKYLKMGSI